MKKLLRDQILYTLLQGGTSKEALYLLEKIQIKFPGPYFYVITISFDDEKNVSDELLVEMQEELEYISREANEFVYAVSL